jgi:hypothetical protein
MSEKSAAELERDADIARAKVADTADSIRSKMTPGQLIDEFTGMFTGGEGSAMLGNFKSQVRDNPLPLTLIGAGLAWLMLGNGTSATNSAATYRAGTAPDAFSDPRGDDFSAPSEGSGVGAMLSDTAGSVTSAAGGAAKAATNAVTGAKESMTRTAGQLGANASDITARARRSAQDLFEREPLAIAAVGLALGTAIGVMLPHTATVRRRFSKRVWSKQSKLPPRLTKRSRKRPTGKARVEMPTRWQERSAKSWNRRQSEPRKPFAIVCRSRRTGLLQAHSSASLQEQDCWPSDFATEQTRRRCGRPRS